MTSELLFVVGLTGVGKSTALRTFTARQPRFTLLPNRRELTDAYILPVAQRALGERVRSVEDRLERFRLTAAYRDLYRDGIVHALQRYLSETAGATSPSIFDNIRGAEECRAALEAFPEARFVMLDAPPFTRLERLVARKDSFDTLSAPPSDLTLDAVDGADKVFSSREVRTLEALIRNDEAWLDGARIVVAESRNYDGQAARDFLEARLGNHRFLCLDTARLSPADVAAAIETWF